MLTERVLYYIGRIHEFIRTRDEIGRRTKIAASILAPGRAPPPPSSPTPKKKLQQFGKSPPLLALDGECGGSRHVLWVFDIKTKNWTVVKAPAEFAGFVFSVASFRI